MDSQKPDSPQITLIVILRVSLGRAWGFYTRSRLSKWIVNSVCATVPAGAVLIALLAHETPLRVSPQRTVAEQVTGSFATRLGGHNCQLLPDGSKVCLNTASQIRYTFTRNARNVVLLAGEVSFEVQHDATRRFSVLSGHTVIQDIGTSFDIY